MTSAEGGEKKAGSWLSCCGLLVFGTLCLAGVILALPLAPCRCGWFGCHSSLDGCANTLSLLGVSSIAYMNSNVGPGMRAGYMPHVRGVDELDGPQDVGKAFEMLIRTGELDDARVFVCPSSTDIPRLFFYEQADGNEQADWLKTFTFNDSDVSSSADFSYGWVKRQLTSSNAKSRDAISADRSLSPEADGSQVTSNILNHVVGRNVLHYDGSTSFVARDAEVGATPDQEVLDMLDQLNIIPAR